MLQANMQLFERYAITKKIGSGTFADVWAADDTRLGRSVAVKVLPIEKGYDIDESEVKLMAKLHHQNVITLWDFEVSQAEGAVYLIMEHAKGGTLRMLLKRQDTLPEKQAVEYALQLCAGLAHAHDKDVMHRDLKPANLFIGEGGLKIGDFGLARILEGSQKASSSGTSTVAYSAPEQFDPGYDKRVDIWAAGIILFEILTGDVPFHGGFRQLMKQICLNDVEIPSSISPNLAQIINKALEKEPDERYQTALELQTALEGCTERGSVPFNDKQVPVPSPKKSPKPKSEAKTASEYFDEGFAYGKSEQYQEAIEAYKQAIKIKPDLAMAYNNMGWAYDELGQYQEAIEAYKQALQIDPKYTLAYNNLKKIGTPEAKKVLAEFGKK